jgi:CubicO group peptidase (beta-lactamase class C family)
MMTRRLKLGALLGTIGFGSFASACADDIHGSAALTRRWGGVLGSGPNALRLVLEITPDQPVVLVSVDQNNGRILATKGAVTAQSLDLTFAGVRGRLKLALNPQGALVGTWHQGSEQAISFTQLSAGQNPVAAPLAPFRDLQSEVDAARAESKAPALGGAFVTVKQGQARAQEALNGVLVQGQTQTVTQGLKWHVGSVTKSMTATLVGRLVERGLLAWDIKLGDAFGEMAPDMLAQYRDVTLSQLMTGRSGMPTNIKIPDIIAHVASDETASERRKTWTNQALALPPENAPGAGFVYPNNGYVLAGTLCEKVTGKAYEALMQEEVFTPLGMNSVGFGPPEIGNPQGHRNAIFGGRVMPVGVDDGADNAPAMSPAGRAHMTLPDLAKFGLAHSEGHQGLRNTYLKQETWQFLHTPPQRKVRGGEYAYGWIVRPDGTLWHNGSNTYWLAELAFDPTKSVSACACANYFESAAAVGRVLAAGMSAFETKSN